MSALRTVTGDLSHVDGTPWTGGMVVFEMRSGPYTVLPALTYPQEEQGVSSGADGSFSIDLMAGLGIWWVCHLPDGDAFQFALNDGAPITLEQLRAEALGAPVPISYPTADMVITAPSAGQMIRHNGVQFVNVDSLALAVTDMGAVGDGVADDTLAIQAAIDAVATAGGGVVILPQGNYKVTATLVMPYHIPVSIQGVGGAVANLDLVGEGILSLADAPYGSLITWAGGASPVFTSSRLHGVFWHSFAIDGGGVATYGMQHDRVVHSTITNIRIARCATAGIRLWVDLTTGEGDNCMWNTLSNLRLDRSPKGLILDGVVEDGLVTCNCCINTFSNITIDHTADYGLDLIICDNNTFVDFYSFQRPPLTIDNYAIRFGPYAINNYFYHSQGRAYAAATSITLPPDPNDFGGNSIMGYDRGNGQLLPTIEDGAQLEYTTNGLNAHGWRVRSLTLGTTSSYSDEAALDTTSTGGESYIDARLIRNALSPIDRDVRIGYNSGTGGAVTLWGHLTEAMRVSADNVEFLNVPVIVYDEDMQLVRTTGNASLQINAQETGHDSAILLMDDDAVKWTLYRDANNQFRILNGTLAAPSLVIDDATNLVSIESDRVRVASLHTPASSAAAGVQGSVCWDSDYVYVAVGTNTWKRAALTTW